MARFPRVNIEGALYYVTSRGDHNQKIFLQDGDYNYYLVLLNKYKTQYGFRLFGFALLADHFHLLIEVNKNATMPQIMHNLNSNYTKYFNSTNKRQGHLFQERYRMAIVEKEKYLLPVSAYIHLNPVALGLAADPADYKYSSYTCYINEKTESLNLSEEIKEVKKLLAGKPYGDFIKGLAKEEMEKLGLNLNKKPILGTAKFIQDIKSKMAAGKIETERLKSEPKRINKRVILSASALVLIFGILGVFFYESQLQNKETNFKKVSGDLDKKYRGEIDEYYKELYKALEAEKQKAKFLENKISEEAREK